MSIEQLTPFEQEALDSFMSDRFPELLEIMKTILTIEHGELTVKLKIRERVVNKMDITESRSWLRPKQ